jgi:hypothetical protein
MVPDATTIERGSGWIGRAKNWPRSDARQRAQPEESSASTVKFASGNSGVPS